MPSQLRQEPLPVGVRIARINYDDVGQSLVSALQGQQLLVMTLSVSAPPDIYSKIVEAAAKAGIPYIMSNVYGFDIVNKTLGEEDPWGATSLRHCVDIESLGVLCVAMVCGFWYERSLALGEPWFGFEIKNNRTTFLAPGDRLDAPAVSQWKNKPSYFASFRISQRVMLIL